MSDSAVRQVVPIEMHWPTLDPFLFCAFHMDQYPAGNAQMAPPAESLRGRSMGSDFDPSNSWRMYHGQTVPGFPVHPHRGFETITVVRQGVVDHFDSMGATGRYGAGDTQWMTAGSGVQHSEMFPLVNTDSDNSLVLFQVWINLPKARKLADPHFVMFWNEQTPRRQFTDADGRKVDVEIIAGTLDGTEAQTPPPASWASEPENEVAVWVIDMQPGSNWTLPAAGSGLNRVLYFYEGETLLADGTELQNMSAAVLQSDLPAALNAGKQGAKVLLLQGRPIAEPVAQYGPFVMNSDAEIQQAFRDYQTTQFGGWEWGRNDPVHPQTESRLARLADGTEERP